MMNDVYYTPENFGLTQIAQLDDDNADYSFDMIVAWKHQDGSIYWGADAGCSCPSPFEDYKSLAQLNRAASDLRDLQDGVNAHRTHTQAEADRFMEAVRKAVANV